MAITEHSRHQMLEALTHAIGEGPAMTLAEHLPPVGWGDVATKQDLAHLESRLDLRFESIDLRFEAVDHRFEAVDHHFEMLDHRLAASFEGIEERFEAMNHRFDGMNHRFDGMNHRFDALSSQVDAEIHKALYRCSVGTFAVLGIMLSVIRPWS